MAPDGEGGGRVISGLDPGLRERFRAAEAQIAWRDAPSKRPSKAGRPSPPKGARGARSPRMRVRIAHLNDEEARVEESTDGESTSCLVDSGPVGALVLLLELDRRGPPVVLTTRDADPASPFPQGAIEARWTDGPVRRDLTLSLADLVQLARYALA